MSESPLTKAGGGNEGEKEVIRGKLALTRMCGIDTNTKLMHQQKNARPQR